MLLLLDQEKKAPLRFFSLSSSPTSSFRDRPDFDFPLNFFGVDTLEWSELMLCLEAGLLGTC